MATEYKDDSIFNPRTRAQTALDTIINEDEADPDVVAPVSVQAELRANPVSNQVSNRSLSRVLFVTTNTNYLATESVQLQSIIKQAPYFAEQHIVVLTSSRVTVPLVRRVGPAVWVYRCNSPSWWQTPFTILRYARAHLLFANHFRPDFIVALEPYLAAVASYRLAKRFGRPWQVHVGEDFTLPAAARSEGHRYGTWLAKFALHRAASIRVSQSSLIPLVRQYAKKIVDIQILPVSFDVSVWLDTKPSFSVRERYPQYSFMMVYAGQLTVDSEAYRVLDAVRFLLKSPWLALVVIGDGPQRSVLEERAKLLGIAEQVIFVSNTGDLIAYLKTADLSIIPEVNPDRDRAVLQSAAAGIPVVTVANTLRSDLFVHGEEMFLCEPADTDELRQYITKLVNDTALRKRFVEGAQYVVTTRLEQTDEDYWRAYRDSLELAFGSIGDQSPTGDTNNTL